MQSSRHYVRIYTVYIYIICILMRACRRVVVTCVLDERIAHGLLMRYVRTYTRVGTNINDHA